MVSDPDRLVYSTGKGRICPRCGWPAADCHCSESLKSPEEPLPARITARLRLETHGRGGKSVTVIEGLPKKESFLKELAWELKKACATGGRIEEGTIELQGDQRERLKELLARKGFLVKG